MSGQYPGQFGPPTVPALRPGQAAGPYGPVGRALCALAPLLTVGLLGMVPSLLLAIRRRRVFDVVGAVLVAAVFLTFMVSAGLSGGEEVQNPADTVASVTMGVLWFGTPLHYLLMDRRALWPALAAAPAPLPAGYAAPPVAAGPYAPTAPIAQVGQVGPGGAGFAHHAPTVTAGPVVPAPAAPYGHPAPAPHPPRAAAAGVPATPAPGFVPAPAAGAAPTPAPGAAPGAEPADELRELGELLRRQAREGRP